MSRKQLQLVISMVDKVTKPYKGIIQTSKKFTDNFQDANKSIRSVSQSSAIYSGKLRNLKNELNQLNPKSKNFVSEQKRLKTSIAQTNLVISTQSSRLKKEFLILLACCPDFNCFKNNSKYHKHTHATKNNKSSSKTYIFKS